MRTVPSEGTTLDECVRDALEDRVIVTRAGVPVALVIGLEGMDEEQVRLGASDDFWKLIGERRRQATIDRAALEARLAGSDKGRDE